MIALICKALVNGRQLLSLFVRGNDNVRRVGSPPPAMFFHASASDENPSKFLINNIIMY
jgi:hypothetical protein